MSDFLIKNYVLCNVILTIQIVQKIFHAPHFRAYLNHDPVGAELAGALKNVIAIAAGACEGLGFKSNTTSQHVGMVKRQSPSKVTTVMRPDAAIVAGLI